MLIWEPRHILHDFSAMCERRPCLCLALRTLPITVSSYVAGQVGFCGPRDPLLFYAQRKLGTQHLGSCELQYLSRAKAYVHHSDGSQHTSTPSGILTLLHKYNRSASG